VQTHDAIRQDWEMVDVAVLNMGANDLSFQNLRSKIGRWLRISVRLPS
jgi:hypothetical protein